MKPSIASFLSISAIVVAGGAALAVNATVFEAPSTAAATDTPEVLAVAGTGGQPIATEVAIGELGSQDTIVDGASPTTTIAQGDVAVATLSEYEIPGVGVVTIAQNGSLIAIDNITTSSGYTYQSNEPFPGRLDVRFTSATTEIEFDAQLIDGRIVTVIKSRAINAATSTGTRSTAKNERDDEDEHEEEHGERHEDEHDEDDDD